MRLAAGDEDITLPRQSIPVAAEMLYFDESGVVSELGDLDEIIRQYKPLAFEHHLREVCMLIDCDPESMCTDM